MRRIALLICVLTLLAFDARADLSFDPVSEYLTSPGTGSCDVVGDSLIVSATAERAFGPLESDNPHPLNRYPGIFCEVYFTVTGTTEVRLVGTVNSDTLSRSHAFLRIVSQFGGVFTAMTTEGMGPGAFDITETLSAGSYVAFATVQSWTFDEGSSIAFTLAEAP